MKLLELNDLELVGLIGSGESGKVYLAKDKQGNKFAVKVFEGMSIHRGLLAKALGRLEDGGWPGGVMKLEKLDLEERPAFSVMPYFGDDDLEIGKRRLWNLQDRLEKHPGDDTWNVIRDIADALAEMHRKRVVHGNLKPSNVFFDESGKLQLADWMLGNIFVSSSRTIVGPLRISRRKGISMGCLCVWSFILSVADTKIPAM
jgi:eukaryotic-like serine/threonine-protein kinase